jgi:hypothetical protein
MKLLAAALLVAQVAAFAAIAARGLGRFYPALMAYLAASMVRGISLGSLDPRSSTYLELWMWTLPLVMTLQVLVGAECYRKSFAELPGITGYIHVPIVATCLMAASWASSVNEPLFTQAAQWRVNRAVAITLFVACLGSAALVRILRPWRKRNLVIHERILAVHFLTNAVMTLWPAYGWVNGIVSIGCCACWALLLDAAGENSHRPRPIEGAETAAEDLKQISQGLSGVLRF